MNILLLAPSDRSFIARFLPKHDVNTLPIGYSGAPFIGTIIDELLKLNHQVTAITTSPAINNDYQIKEFEAGNFKWVVIPSRPNSIRMNGRKIGRILDLFNYEQKQMAAYILEQSTPDILHAHWSYEFAGAAVRTKLPCLVTVHDNAFKILRYFKNAYRFGRLCMAEYILNKVRFASTVSPYMKSYTERKIKHVEVIPNPITIDLTDKEVHQKIKTRCKTLNSPQLIMINNGWDKHKNGLSGLLAFQQLQANHPLARLYLFGAGSEKGGKAELEAQELGLKNIFFEGVVTHDELIAVLDKTHCLIHPALEESFGVVLIEAMSRGVPVVGGRNSGAVPWVIGEPDLLVDVTDPKKIAKKLLTLLSDQKSYEEHSLKAYSNVLTRFAATPVVASYLDYYTKIIKAW